MKEVKIFGCFVWKVPHPIDIGKLEIAPLEDWELIYQVTGDAQFTLDKCKELYRQFGPKVDGPVVVGVAKGNTIELDIMEVK